MADEFQSPLCSNGSWWNTMRGVGCPVTVPAAASPFSCSSAVIDDMGCFFMDSSLPPTDFGLSSPTKDWSQPFFSGRAENSSHAVHHEELVPKPYFQQDPATAMGDSNHIQEMNQFLFSEQHPFTSDRESGKGAVSYPYLQGLLENEVSLQHLPSSNFDPPQFSQFFKPSSNQNGQLPLVHQFHFNNNNSNNNNSTTTYDEGKSTGHRLYSSGNNNTPSVSRSHEEKSSSNCSTATKKSNSEGSRSTSTVSKKNGNDQPATKRPRIEMPSPLPTFNVRKEKLQDRVTALQQLVSPFGKTDTASVLHEAVEYIKFLHDQVKVLSAPYMESGHPMHSQQKLIGSNDVKEQKRDLRSQGLCLIPISSTFAVADEPIADYWIPTFGGSLR